MPGNGATRFDPRELLCERCGYSIEGLDEEGDCPECGERIWKSLPERRVGSAWQRQPGFRSLILTWRSTIRHPIKTMDAIAVGTGRETSLAAWTCAPTLLLWPIIMVLTLIEARGIRFFGNWHGYRITRSVAWAICAHAAVGWLLAIPGLIIGLVLTDLSISRTIQENYFPDTFSPYPEWISSSLLLGTGIGIASASVIGALLFFESVAWLGMRRCKFANMPREQGEGSATASPAGPSASP